MLTRSNNVPMEDLRRVDASVSWSKTILFSLIPVLLLLTLAEGGLRVYALYFRTVYERYDANTGRLELVPGFDATLPDGHKVKINSRGFVGPDFDEKKAPMKYRIFTLGDSCTFGGDWDMSYAVFLNKELNASRERYEVINAGIEGYNSEYALGRLQDDILQYDPDLVTIYIGWNDLMKSNPSNMSSIPEITWLGKVISNSFLYKALSKMVFFHLRPMLTTPALTGEESEYHAYDDFIPSDYEQNVSAMVNLLLERNVKVLLMTRPTALRRGITAEDIRTEHIFFPFFPDAYSVPRLLSLHGAYNRSIHRLGERFQVPVVDLDVIFNTKDKPSLFWDTMHPSKPGHELIASVLAPHIQKLLVH
jgi:lysophospholipase L1-like esterase